MTEEQKEKVLCGLHCCGFNDGIPHICLAGCPYGDVATCYHRLAHDASVFIHELLKEQRARVLTLEEVKAMDRLTYCVIEPHSKAIKNTFNAEYRGIVTIGTDNFLDFGLYADTNPYRRTEAGYGKTWRCWTSRPTDEQRKAAPWN